MGEEKWKTWKSQDEGDNFYNSLLTTHFSLHLQGKYFLFFKNKYQDQIGINLLKLPPFYPIN